jgi:hypothetical protein
VSFGKKAVAKMGAEKSSPAGDKDTHGQHGKTLCVVCVVCVWGGGERGGEGR